MKITASLTATSPGVERTVQREADERIDFEAHTAHRKVEVAITGSGQVDVWIDGKLVSSAVAAGPASTLLRAGAALRPQDAGR